MRQPSNHKESRTIRLILASVFLLAFLCINLPAFAQGIFSVNTPGTAFSPMGRGVSVDNVGGGRQFSATNFATAKLRAQLKTPPPDPGKPAIFDLQRLVVHFRTSEPGPSLRSVELLNGNNSEFKKDVFLKGDFTAKETNANSWDFKGAPIRVGPQSVIILEVSFPGGFDSSVPPGDFVLTGVLCDYPRVLHLNPPLNSQAVKIEPSIKTSMGAAKKTWTKEVWTPVGSISYNANTGAALIGKTPYKPGSFATGWTHIVYTPNGILWYNENTGAGAIGRIDSAGNHTTSSTYDSFQKGWSRIENAPDGIHFYNDTTGAVAVGQITADGKFINTR
jgi:hypothetical protein